MMSLTAIHNPIKTAKIQSLVPLLYVRYVHRSDSSWLEKKTSFKKTKNKKWMQVDTHDTWLTLSHHMRTLAHTYNIACQYTAYGYKPLCNIGKLQLKEGSVETVITVHVGVCFNTTYCIWSLNTHQSCVKVATIIRTCCKINFKIPVFASTKW